MKNRISLLVSLFVLLTFFLSFIPVAGPGIEQPTAIGAYLNGLFPDRAPSGSNSSYSVQNAFPNLTFTDPVAMLEVPGEDSYFIVGKQGRIWQIDDNASTSTKDVVLNISSRVDTDGDSGVLNGILHPEFSQAGSPNRGYIYLIYRFHPDGNVSSCGADAFVRLSRFNRPDGSVNFDPNSELVLVQVFDEHCWHNGGGMFFDADGLFYFTIGDAGGANDEYNTAQQIDKRLLSGLFRIDLEKDPGRSHPIRRQQVDPPGNNFSNYSSFQQGYYVPNDNPWQDPNGGVLEEFYALGLRSPHRASMDLVTGNIYVGDVGQGSREEISLVTKGSNQQWPFYQGTKFEDDPPDPLIGVSTPPVYDYSHSVGTAIIGGFVYRGGAYLGALDGKYIFGDHGVRNVWTFNPANQEVEFLVNVPASGSGNKNGISSFATNSAGDIFILKLYGTNQDGGRIYRLNQSASGPQPPDRLSQTGAFTNLSTLTPAPGLVPYTVNAPLWSDRAEKRRWIALPNNGSHNTSGEQIAFSPTGNWQFPEGTVFVKHFELPVDYNNPNITKKVETRFLILDRDGGAYGLTYKWRADGSDADLLEGGDTRVFSIANGSPATQTWEFPNRTDCLTCHNANAGFVLGANTWQLNGDFNYPVSGVTDNQLNTWNHLGMFANGFSPAQIPGFLQSVHIEDAARPAEVRVRSYLDANCSHCHRPDGVEGAFDARFSTPLQNQHIVQAVAESRNTPNGQHIVKPFSTQKSELWVRDGSLGPNAMPPLAKKIVHTEYMAVLTDWINSMEGECIDEESSVCGSGNCQINGNPIVAGSYAAEQQITSVGTVAAETYVGFNAGALIRLRPGFKVAPGGVFKARIVDCQAPAELTVRAPAEQPAEQIDLPGPGNREGKEPENNGSGRELTARIFPNPFSDELTLYLEAPFPELKRAMIRIMDISGRIIYQKFNAPFGEEITIWPHRGWISGIYLVQVQASDYRFSQTVVKH